MMLQVIMLLLGGFAIAGALSKHFIAKSMATAILSRVGRQPHWVLLANMLVATFLSMFISNVAAPVLCFGLVQPILRTYAAGQSCCLITSSACSSQMLQRLFCVLAWCSRSSEPMQQVSCVCLLIRWLACALTSLSHSIKSLPHSLTHSLTH